MLAHRITAPGKIARVELHESQAASKQNVLDQWQKVLYILAFSKFLLEGA